MLLIAAIAAIMAAGPEKDTLRNVQIEEINIVSTLKESGTLRQQPASTSHISASQLENHNMAGMKDLGSMAPNFFMPDYGSRQTSAIYMRGIGSRIGTPTVGLYVDNVPYYDKSAFDFSFYDIESIDILRGPQSTLYGRNAMSGIVRMHTKNPFEHTGTDVRLGYATADNHRNAAITHYHRISDRFAFSAGGFYDGTSGFFRNGLTNKKVDAGEAGGGRIRAILKANDRLTLDANASYEYSDEGAYPYYYTGATNGAEEYEGMKGMITANLDGRYRRGLLNASINTEYKTDQLTFNSVTAYQNINDRMFMDQDFLAADIYSLEQKQRINTLSEELLLKNNADHRWEWIAGANIFYQWLNTKAPVTFRQDGISWLNSTINTNANKYLPTVQSGPMTMQFLFADNIQGNSLAFLDRFDTPTLGTALFHQSTFKRLFGVEHLSASIGLRLDYEKMWMQYGAWYDFSHRYSLNGHLTMPNMQRDIVMVKEQEYNVSNHSLNGKITNDYLQLLPKFAVKYDFGNNSNVYALVSRGYRSGGYNVQNISEVMRMQMQTDMMKDVCNATLPVLDAQPMVPADTKQQVAAILNKMAADVPADIESTCLYKPEYAWNYEVGTHLTLLNNRLNIDLNGFVCDVRNLQISKMSATGLGRNTVNAGRSRSVGTEFSLRALPTDRLAIGASYGYTHASLRNYSIASVSNTDIDCRGNRVPYVPEHTMNIDLAYTVPFTNSTLNSMTFGADCSGVGRIWWDEQNTTSQPFYAQLGARIQLQFKHMSITLWGRNLTNTHFNTFWFESMNRGYEQHGKPIQAGVNISMKL